jgi:Flp pilus assembly protein TadD
MKLLKIGERFNDAYYYLGQIAERENTAKTALTWYKKVDGGNNYLNAIARVVLILIDQKGLTKALDYLHKVEVDEEDLLILIQFEAELLVEHKRYTQAMTIYNQALEDYQDNTELLYMRALLAEKIGDMKQLEQDLRHILLLEPNNVQALNALGYSLADNNTDRLEEAYDLIQRALILRPEDYYILDSMGWVLYRMGHYEEAIEYLRKAQTKQDDPEVAAHLGEVLWISGDKQAAQVIWEQARARFPEDEQLREVMQRFLP